MTDEHDDPAERRRVRVIYRNGVTVDFEAERFVVNFNGLNQVTTMEWINAVPKPLLIGVDEIAAVWDMGPATEQRA